ncbi:MAG: hypothetical protein J6T45_04755 [Fibrobacterales bacterium]|nr:hypothetical protein [Fibrobacterales bacterium]
MKKPNAHYITELDQNDTGLPMRIWVDEANGYERCGLPKQIWFQINRSEKQQYRNLCPMNLNGDITDDDFAEALENRYFDLEEEDVRALQNFVRNNRYALDKLADQLLYFTEFYEIFIAGGRKASFSAKKELWKKTNRIAFKHLRVLEEEYRRDEERLLVENPNMSKDALESPVNFWLDDKERTTKHSSDRLKFQMNKSHNFGSKEDFYPISSEGEIYHEEKLNGKRNFDLTQRDIKEIKQFIKNNSSIAQKAVKMEIGADDFAALAIKGTKKTNQKEKDDLERRTNALIADMKNCRNKDEKRKVRNKYKYRKRK